MFLFEFDAGDERAAKTARAELLRYLEREAGPDADLPAVQAIFGELVGNVWRHASRQASIAVSWRRDGAALLEVVDRGPGLDLTQWRSPQEMAEHGRGLVIVSALSPDVAIAPGPRGTGTRVQAALPVRRRKPAA